MNPNLARYNRIVENIYTTINTCDLYQNIGLHSGTSGLILFLAYYNRVILQKNDICKRITEIINHNVDYINSGIKLHSISGGISGFGWLCEHLCKIEMLERESVDEFLDNLDPFLYMRMMTDIKDGNYDYLHGALGVGSYFLNRLGKKNVPEYLKELLMELEKSSITCQNGAIKWSSWLNSTRKERGYNISLSHGMSSIAAFLIRLYQLDFESDRARKLLAQTITYIIDQRNYKDGKQSYFPHYSIESSPDGDESRLGWCYGDLGIAYILLEAAHVLQNKEVERIALLVLQHCVDRKNLQKSGVYDAGLCHGSAGIAHIFTRLHLNTNINAFQEASEYWLKVTLDMSKYADGLVGYKAWRRKEYGGPVKTENLLEGIAGIGLYFLSLINGEEITWDECLMLS